MASKSSHVRPGDGTSLLISEDAAAPALHYHSHRQRLRERFLRGGADAMPDYELMELVLFAAIPRRDVKPLAKALIAKFGSFAEAIAASPQKLTDIDGVGDAVVAQFKIVEAAALR